MNLMTLSKEIGENLQGFFVFYKGEDKCPFVEGNPLSVMWRAEKDLLYSEKVFDEWIVGNLIILRDDNSYVRSFRDKYLVCQIGLLVNREPLLFGHEVVEYCIKNGYFGDFAQEMRRLCDLAKSSYIR